MKTESDGVTTGHEGSFKVIVMAASVGGVKAVGDVLAGLPLGFPGVILVVQHRPPDLRSLLGQVLGHRTALTVKEGEEGDVLRTGMVFVAPPGKHMLVHQTGTLTLSSGPKVRHSRPAADPLFESVANIYKNQAVAVVLTGMDRDGSDGVKFIKEQGGYVIAQDAETAEAPHMPMSAMMTGVVDAILPLQEIAPALLKLVASHPEERA